MEKLHDANLLIAKFTAIWCGQFDNYLEVEDMDNIRDFPCVPYQQEHTMKYISRKNFDSWRLIEWDINIPRTSWSYCGLRTPELMSENDRRYASFVQRRAIFTKNENLRRLEKKEGKLRDLLLLNYYTFGNNIRCEVSGNLVRYCR